MAETKPSKILISTLGSRGDVQPYVALAETLLRRGHHVVLSTGQGFDGLLSSHKVESAPLSIDIRALLTTPDVKAAMKSPRGLIKAFRSTRHLIEQQFNEMWDITKQLNPDIIVYHPKTSLAPYLASALGAIAIPSFLQPAFAPTGAFTNPIIRSPDLGRFANYHTNRTTVAFMRRASTWMHNRWLKKHPDVAAQNDINWMHGHHPAGKAIPRLNAHSRHIVPKPADWKSDDHVTGYWFFDHPQEWAPPDALTRFLANGSPPVYFGFGSMPDIDSDHTASAIIGAIKRTNIRAILATGWGALANAASDDAIFSLESAPHDWLFPQCRAVVHHGGAGTTHEGLRWGKPTLICPVFGDQPFWGERVEKISAGPAPIALKNLDADRLSHAINALMSNRYEEQAAQCGHQIRAEHGTNTAADLIENVA